MRLSKGKCLAALALALAGVTPAFARPVKVGEQAPKFTITTFDKRKIKLEDLRGGYGIQNAVPTNYVIDRKGIVRYSQAGAFELDELNALVLPLLRESAPQD